MAGISPRSCVIHCVASHHGIGLGGCLCEAKRDRYKEDGKQRACEAEFEI